MSSGTSDSIFSFLRIALVWARLAARSAGARGKPSSTAFPPSSIGSPTLPGAIASTQAKPGHEPGDVVQAHVRRLEALALRRAGIVERVIEGVWQVPADLQEQGRQYDVQRLGGITRTCRLPSRCARSVRTWLDRQLIGGVMDVGEHGFGAKVRDALRQRADFLVEQGLAEHMVRA